MSYPAVSNQNPIDRHTFKQYCLRRLGHPVLEINVEDSQVEDRIDDALLFFMDYHYDGTETQYYKYQFTPTDVANGYITLPDNIIGAIDIFNLGASYGSSDMFNIRYQIALNDLYTLTSVSMVPYYMAMQHISLLQELLVGKQPLRYNRLNNQLHIDMDWNVTDMAYIIVVCYSVIDPDLYPRMWSERWLKNYATALIKRQWGENLKKYGSMQMPGGVIFNGQTIWNEASAEVSRLEQDLISICIPATDMIG